MADNISGVKNLRFQDNYITPLLPLAPTILKLFNRIELCQRVCLENTPDGFKVKLRLPISGSGDQVYDFERVREYSVHNGEIIRLDNLPLLEIWPNFDNPSWRAYYTYWDTVGRHNTFYAKPLISIGATKSEPFFNSREELEREITRFDSFPEGFYCEAKLGDAKIPAGIILLKQPPSIAMTTKSWNIGIDFGILGTNVFAREDGGVPFRVVFRERLMQITAPGAVRANLYKYFIQDDPHRTKPFLTIYHDFQNFSDDELIMEPLLNGHIFFLSIIEDFKAKALGAVTDLKWDSSADVRIRVRAFLEQLCLQCVAEAIFNGIEKISWRFSYPNVFTKDDKFEIQNLLELVFKRCSEKTGITSIEERPLIMRENLAVAHFFADYPEFKVPFTKGAVCILMGESTTEIAIWREPGILCRQISLFYAGRDIFKELLRQKPDLLQAFGINGPEIDYLKTIIDSQEAFYSQVEAIIRKKGDELIKQLPILAAAPVVRGFINLMALGLAGLFYYIGLLLLDLNLKGYNQPQRPNIFIGGYYSQIVRWISGGELNSNSPIIYLLKNILIQAFGFETIEEFGIYLSPCPNDEVTYGLVVSDSFYLSYNDNLSSKEIIAGEVFNGEESQPYSWNTILSGEIIRAGIRVSDELPQLKTFLDHFNYFADKLGLIPVEYDEQFLIDITDGLNLTLWQWTDSIRDKATVEIKPLFIEALKIFIEMKAEEWAKKFNN